MSAIFELSKLLISSTSSNITGIQIGYVDTQKYNRSQGWVPFEKQFISGSNIAVICQPIGLDDGTIYSVQVSHVTESQFYYITVIHNGGNHTTYAAAINLYYIAISYSPAYTITPP